MKRIYQILIGAVVLAFGWQAVGAPPAEKKATLPGAIFTTLVDGSAVDENIYPFKTSVYLDGGPRANANLDAAALPNGDYYFQVTEPNGVLLSTDPIANRMLTVYGGQIVATTHPFGTDLTDGGLTVQLMPYLDTSNAGGEYKAWVTPVGEYDETMTVPGNKNGFVPSMSKTDNFKVWERDDDEGDPDWEGFIAYEDLLPEDDLADTDLNDLVSSVLINEIWANGYVQRVEIKFVPRARGAGDNHTLVLVLDGVPDSPVPVYPGFGIECDPEADFGFQSSPAINGGYTAYVDVYNGPTFPLDPDAIGDERREYSTGEDLVIFEDTIFALSPWYGDPHPFSSNTALGSPETLPNYVVKVTIELDDPQLNPILGRDAGIPKYRPILFNRNDKTCIDILEVRVAENEVVPSNFPYGVAIENTAWQWPWERVHINDAYPYFQQYFDFLVYGTPPADPVEAMEWYLYALPAPPVWIPTP